MTTWLETCGLRDQTSVPLQADQAMTEISRQVIAERAGVDPAYVGRLVELGILSPFRTIVMWKAISAGPLTPRGIRVDAFGVSGYVR